MIKGQQLKERSTIVRSEVNYRALSALNCSMIKLFDSDPVKFFEQFKLGKPRKEKKSTSLIIGDIVDFYILDCKGDEVEFDNRFDEKFALFEDTKGVGQVFVLADILFEITQHYTNEEGVITVSFEQRFTEACGKAKALGKYSKKTEEKILEDFNDNGYDYFKCLLENVGKTVVEVSLLDKAKRVAQLILEDPFTEDLFHDDDHEEYFPKFAIEWTYKTISGKETSCKSEVDMLKINHTKKIIYIRDLKTTYDNEGFEYGYLKYRYDLQAAFYYLAVKHWAGEEGMEKYKIMPMEFVVADTSANNRRPIRYQTSEKDLDASLKGFKVNNIQYKGIFQLMEEIDWAEKTDNWNVSKVVHDNKGVLKLDMRYEVSKSR